MIQRQRILFILSSLILGAALLSADDSPPDSLLEDRVAITKNGLTIEYDQVHEKYIEPIFSAHRQWAHAIEANKAKQSDSSHWMERISKESLQTDQGAILAEIAAALAIENPGPWQIETFEAYLDMFSLEEAMDANFRRLLLPNKIAIWNGERLKAALRSGYHIEGFSYDPGTDRGTFKFTFNTSSALEELDKEIQERRRLSHSFRFKSDDNTVSTAARVSTEKPEEAAAESVQDKPESNTSLPKTVSYPIILSPEERSQPTRQLAERKYIGLVRNTESKLRQSMARMRLSLAYVLLHETIEITLAEQYIVSSDRRWICDGMANFQAWKIAANRLGTENANRLYDWNSQLRRYAHRQDEIDLFVWKAVENQEEILEDEELDKARYAFATRVVADIADKFGDEALTELWKQVGKSPRDKTNMKTVAKAFRKVTGSHLKRFVEKSVNAPIETEDEGN